MKYFFKIISPVVFIALLSSCTSSVKNNVTRFHQLPPPNGASIEVIAMDPQLQQSIEFGTYANMIGQKLGVFGYSPPQNNTSLYVAEITYEIQPLRGAIIEGRSPVTIGVGVGSGGGYRGGTSMGVGISSGFGGSGARMEYISLLSLNIIRLSDGTRLYEGRVEGRSKDNNLSNVMPFMIDALFQDFPGESGASNMVKFTIK